MKRLRSQDLRFGLRLLARRPAFSAGLILTLALGIGANASIFSVVSSVLLHPLPFRDPGRLAVLWAADRKHGDQQVEVSYRDLTEWQRRSRTFEGFAALSSVNLDIALTGGDRPQQVEGMLVSDGFFTLLGSRAQLGRTPSAADVAKGGYLAVISYRLWQSRYAGDPGIIGRSVMADHNPCTIVAVMPPDFDFPHNVDFWYPARPEDMNRNATIRVYSVIGRLRAGQHARTGALRNGEHRRRPGRRVPRTESRTRRARRFHGARHLRQGAAGAMGADGRRGTAAARGLRQRRAICCSAAPWTARARCACAPRSAPAAAAWCAKCWPRDCPSEFSAARPVSCWRATEWRRWSPSRPATSRASRRRRSAAQVLLYTWLLSLVTVLVFMLPAALHASRVAPLGRTAARRRTRGLFVTAQVAVSVMLIVGAVTLARGFAELNRIDPGFHRDHVLTFRITLSKPEYAQQEARKRFYGQLLERLRALPGAQFRRRHSAAPAFRHRRVGHHLHRRRPDRRRTGRQSRSQL